MVEKITCGITVAKCVADKTVKCVAKIRVQKYVHARIGDFVRGEFQRTRELKGKRCKGGRD